MNSKEFIRIRKYLGKTQKQLARSLSVSLRAVHSYEQGWRAVPASVERQLLFLISLRRSTAKNIRPCWEIRSCPDEWKDLCDAWELKVGNICWFVNGTYCEGKYNDIWEDKMQTCRQCEVFKQMIAVIEDK
jgi:DNA-binding XRE family transcriptional regulator